MSFGLPQQWLSRQGSPSLQTTRQTKMPPRRLSAEKKSLCKWPASTTRKEWFAITRQLIQETIAEMDLDPAALAEVEEAFIGAGLL